MGFRSRRQLHTKCHSHFVDQTRSDNYGFLYVFSKDFLASTLNRLIASLVLTLNCFTFSRQAFKQTNRVTIETKLMGPKYANLFVGYVEQQIFN